MIAPFRLSFHHQFALLDQRTLIKDAIGIEPFASRAEIDGIAVAVCFGIIDDQPERILYLYAVAFHPLK